MLADLRGFNLTLVDFTGAFFDHADLRGVDLSGANLSEARFVGARLEGVNLVWANLRKARLRMAAVDGVTLMAKIHIDRKTDMTGVGLGNVRIEPRIRSQLERNIRRIGWRERYKEKWRPWTFPGPLLRIFPGSLLWLSDYGSSTWKIILAFFVLAGVFAGIYLIPTEAPDWAFWHTFNCEPFVTNLDVVIDEKVVNSTIVAKEIQLPGRQTAVRSLYFSVVTMTTLGFGDIHANPESEIGHWLLMAQVLCGYVLLGALITRFAILFQSVE